MKGSLFVVLAFNWLVFALSVTSCSTGMGRCKDKKFKCCPCPVGRFSSDGICTPCGVGTYNDAEGASACSICESGKYAAQGFPECSLCSMGKYQPSSGQTECLIVPAGFRSTSLIGSIDISPCLKNEFSRPGSIKCKSCPEGMSSSAGSSECVATPVPSEMKNDYASILEIEDPIPHIDIEQLSSTDSVDLSADGDILIVNEKASMNSIELDAAEDIHLASEQVSHVANKEANTVIGNIPVAYGVLHAGQDEAIGSADIPVATGVMHDGQDEAIGTADIPVANGVMHDGQVEAIGTSDIPVASGVMHDGQDEAIGTADIPVASGVMHDDQYEADTAYELAWAVSVEEGTVASTDSRADMPQATAVGCVRKSSTVQLCGTDSDDISKAFDSGKRELSNLETVHDEHILLNMNENVSPGLNVEEHGIERACCTGQIALEAQQFDRIRERGHSDLFNNTASESIRPFFNKTWFSFKYSDVRWFILRDYIVIAFVFILVAGFAIVCRVFCFVLYLFSENSQESEKSPKLVCSSRVGNTIDCESKKFCFSEECLYMCLSSIPYETWLCGIGRQEDKRPVELGAHHSVSVELLLPTPEKIREQFSESTALHGLLASKILNVQLLPKTADDPLQLSESETTNLDHMLAQPSSINSPFQSLSTSATDISGCISVSSFQTNLAIEQVDLSFVSSAGESSAGATSHTRSSEISRSIIDVQPNSDNSDAGEYHNIGRFESLMSTPLTGEMGSNSKLNELVDNDDKSRMVGDELLPKKLFSSNGNTVINKDSFGFVGVNGVRDRHAFSALKRVLLLPPNPSPLLSKRSQPVLQLRADLDHTNFVEELPKEERAVSNIIAVAAGNDNVAISAAERDFLDLIEKIDAFGDNSEGQVGEQFQIDGLHRQDDECSEDVDESVLDSWSEQFGEGIWRDSPGVIRTGRRRPQESL